MLKLCFKEMVCGNVTARAPKDTVTLRSLCPHQRCRYCSELSFPQRSCTAITLLFYASMKTTKLIYNISSLLFTSPFMNPNSPEVLLV